MFVERRVSKALQKDLNEEWIETSVGFCKAVGPKSGRLKKRSLLAQWAIGRRKARTEETMFQGGPKRGKGRGKKEEED